MKRRRSDDVVIVTPRYCFTTKRQDAVGAFLQSDGTLYLCEACLAFFACAAHLESHVHICSNTFWIPGNEIFRCVERGFSVFEIDGRKQHSNLYARRLGILTKLFLPDKVTLDDVHFFSYNTLFEIDDNGYHFAGYFSKEWKNSSSCINTLSCVMVLPPYRSKGYGSFLAKLSYEIARKEGMIGTPERPLSSSGKLLFRKVWKDEVQSAVLSLHLRRVPITLYSICRCSGLIVEDVLVALNDLHMLYTVGKQGPLLVMDKPAVKAVKKRKLSSEQLQWSPAS